VAVLMTVGVYGLVALIVKLDDVGLYLAGRSQAFPRRVGELIVRAAPALMKTLSVVGTAAMFAVGGSILVHGIPPLHEAVEHAGGGAVVALALNILVGIVAGAIVLAGVSLVQRVLRKP
jgi:predicted DNA repair protein MutK